MKTNDDEYQAIIISFPNEIKLSMAPTLPKGGLNVKKDATMRDILDVQINMEAHDEQAKNSSATDTSFDRYWFNAHPFEKGEYQVK
jgi:hypothetical protein